MECRLRFLAMAGFVAASAAVVFVIASIRFGILPRCPFHQLTGLCCPGCGSTRALHQLVRGHVLAALRCNLLFVLALPVMAGGYFWERRPRSRKLCRSYANVVALCAVLILFVFAILRNIPVYPFTLLTP
jgi:hypothetical protein